MKASMKDEEQGATAPDGDTLFVVTVNGEAARCEIVVGLDGVHEAFLRALWSRHRETLPRDLAERLASLRDPAAWAAHGEGDGQPFWHWWAGFGDNSVSVQRLTGPVPGVASAKVALHEAAVALASCAAELRLAVQHARGTLRLFPDSGAG
jgi:hypothetical protein